jgi:ferric-dicitrate binding protein FerR (iron transport regulator)
MENTNKIIDLISRESDVNDIDKVISEIKNSEESSTIFNKLKITWALLSSEQVMSEYKIEESYRSLHDKIHPKQTPLIYRLKPLLRYAAIFIFMVSLVSATFFLTRNVYMHSGGEPLYTTCATAYGETSKIILPDGSVVKLNSGTTLSYNNNFSVNNREISLQGEAYFDVVRNENIPLVVNVNEIKVKVLGTAFNVEAFSEEQKINVTLERGSIELSHEHDLFKPILIKPGEFAQFDKENQKLKLQTDGYNKHIAWKNGVLSFVDEPMKEVVAKLERRFNVKIEVNSPSIYNLIFTATIKDENLKEVLNMMKYASNIDYEVQYSHTSEKLTTVILKN